MSSHPFNLTMTNHLVKRFGRRRAIGLGTLLAGAAALAALQACGGGSDEHPDAAPMASTAAATPSPAAADMVSTDADVRVKVLYAGSTKGFVATALSASMPTGTESDYDVLVVGDADQGGDAVVALVQQALSNGKEVVLDGASDGSTRSTHADILQRIVGSSIDSAAVRIQRALKGYYVTPIDSPAIADAKSKASGVRKENASSNSVQSVFGIADKEVAK